MKKLYFSFLVSTCLLTSCSQDVGIHKHSVDIRFEVDGDFSFCPMSRALEADGSTMTDLWVIDVQNGEIVQQVHQTPSDAAWGTPSLTLSLGTHHVMFLASRGQNPAYDDGVVTWTKPLDTFYKDVELTVTNSTNGNRTVTLDRIATKLSFVINDVLPSGTTNITIEPDLWYEGIDMTTGELIASDSYTLPFTISSSQWDRTGLTLSMWGLSGTTEWTTNVAVTSKASATTNASITLTSAPFLANRMTQYTGSLYSKGGTNTILLNTEWLTQIDKEY